MEIFYSDHITGTSAVLADDESQHCVRVLRHREGDVINVIDGEGTMYECRITDADPKMVTSDIVSRTPDWNSHPYRLAMAVCPTKNMDRFEWFVEKATEIGVDVIRPVFGDRSERRVCKTERLHKLVLSAAKQSLKAMLPKVEEPVTVREFIESLRGSAGLKFIACCYEDAGHPRISLDSALKLSSEGDIAILIGPEGDFSPEELQSALDAGFIPVHLGSSRLRTETAALVAVTGVYTARQ